MAWQRIQNHCSTDALSENTDKQFNNIRKMRQEQNEKFYKGVENMKKNQTEIWERKYTVTEQKNSRESFNSKHEQAKIIS